MINVEELDFITEQYTITLNGITADVHPVQESVLLTNNPYNDSELRFDELLIPYTKFLKQLKENNGSFKT